MCKIWKYDRSKRLLTFCVGFLNPAGFLVGPVSCYCWNRPILIISAENVFEWPHLLEECFKCGSAVDFSEEPNKFVPIRKSCVDSDMVAPRRLKQPTTLFSRSSEGSLSQSFFNPWFRYSSLGALKYSRFVNWTLQFAFVLLFVPRLRTADEVTKSAHDICLKAPYFGYSIILAKTFDGCLQHSWWRLWGTPTLISEALKWFPSRSNRD
jgi:hypothetical protein